MFKPKYFIYFIILVSFFSDPYIWLLAFTNDYRVVNVVLITVSIIFLLTKKTTWTKRDEIWFGSFLVVFLFILIHASYFGDSAQMIQGTGYFLKILFIFVVVYFIKNNGIKLLNLFFQFNIVMIVAGVLLFFLLLGGIVLPNIEFHQEGELLEINTLYPLGLVNLQTFIGPIIFTRVGGFTDEPGQLALLITWLLILNEFTLKSVNYRKFLLIGGIFTFSLAYFFSLILFAFYFIFQSKYRSAVIKYLLISVTIILFVFTLLPETVKDIVYLNTVDRLQLTQGGGNQKFEGDNRSSNTQLYYRELEKDDKLLFGYGFTGAQNRENPKLFAVYGFMGCVFNYFPLVVLLFSKKIKFKYKYLLLIIIFNFIQREGIHYIFQMMALTFIYYWPVIEENLDMDNRFNPKLKNQLS